MPQHFTDEECSANLHTGAAATMASNDLIGLRDFIPLVLQLLFRTARIMADISLPSLA